MFLEAYKKTICSMVSVFFCGHEINSVIKITTKRYMDFGISMFMIEFYNLITYIKFQ